MQLLISSTLTPLGGSQVRVLEICRMLQSFDRVVRAQPLKTLPIVLVA